VPRGVCVRCRVGPAPPTCLCLFVGLRVRMGAQGAEARLARLQESGSRDGAGSRLDLKLKAS